MPLNAFFLDDDFDRHFDAERQASLLTSLFASLAVIIACLGLFGLIACTVQQRTREIGIRKVLGASVTQIISLLSRDFIILVAVANMIA